MFPAEKTINFKLLKLLRSRIAIPCQFDHNTIISFHIFFQVREMKSLLLLLLKTFSQGHIMGRKC